MTVIQVPVTAGRARAVDGVDGRKIRALRTRRAQLTQAELAAKVGISRAEISHLENGKRAPLVKTFRALCDALPCEPEEILRDPEKIPSGEKAHPGRTRGAAAKAKIS